MKKKWLFTGMFMLLIVCSIVIGGKYCVLPGFQEMAITFLEAEQAATQKIVLAAEQLNQIAFFTDISTTTSMLGPCYAIILCVYYLIQTLIAFSGILGFVILIPIACICGAIYVWKENQRTKHTMIRLLLLAGMLYFMLPGSVKAMEKLDNSKASISYEESKAYSESVNEGNTTISTNEDELLSLAIQYSKGWGYLVCSRILMPLFFVFIYYKILWWIIHRIFALKAKESVVEEQKSGVVQSADETTVEIPSEESEEVKNNSNVVKKPLLQRLKRRLYSGVRNLLGFVILLVICRYLLYYIADGLGIENDILDNALYGLKNIVPALKEVFGGLKELLF